MGRLVTPKRTIDTSVHPRGATTPEEMPPVEPPGQGADDYATRVAKYIPGEVVAGYTSLSGLAAGINDQSARQPLLWALFVIGLIVTPLYLWKFYKPKGQQYIQVALSTALFAFWAYGLGGPFANDSVKPLGIAYNSQAAGVLLGIVSWLSGMFVPTENP